MRSRQTIREPAYLQGSLEGSSIMTVLNASPGLSSMPHVEQSSSSSATPVAEPSLSASTDIGTRVNTQCRDDRPALIDRYMNFREDRARMANAFTQFAEALVPKLARIAAERPSIMLENFDLRLDDGRLRVVDTDMARADVAWLEARLNAESNIAKLAVSFNESVAHAYGDEDHAFYFTRLTGGERMDPAIPGLAGTVDRDVKYMALLRTIRDADCGRGIEGDYYRAHRYELAADKVKDFILPPETYRKTPAGRVVTEPSTRSSRPSSAGWVA